MIFPDPTSGETVVYTEELFFDLVDGSVTNKCNAPIVPFTLNSLNYTPDCQQVTFEPNLQMGNSSQTISYQYRIDDVYTGNNPYESTFSIDLVDLPNPVFTIYLEVWDSELDYRRNIEQTIDLSAYFQDLQLFYTKENSSSQNISLCPSQSETYNVLEEITLNINGTEFTPASTAPNVEWEFTLINSNNPDANAGYFDQNGNYIIKDTGGYLYEVSAIAGEMECASPTLYVHVEVFGIEAYSDVEVCRGQEIEPMDYFFFCEEMSDFIWDSNSSEIELNTDNPSNPTATIYASGSIQLKATGVSGNNYQYEFPISVLSLPQADAGEDIILCQEESAQLTATGGVTYFWQPKEGLSNPYIANPTVSVEETTTYTVWVIGENGCYSTDEITVEYSDVNPEIDVEFLPIEACIGEPVNLFDYLEGNYGNPGHVS